MKVKARALIMAGILSVSLALPVMAAPTLGEVTNGNTTTQEQEVAPFNGSGSGESSSNGNSSNAGGSSAIDALSNAVDVSEENETVRNVQNAAKQPLTIIFQLMAYAITMGLTFRVLCDLTYITIPPLRGFLSGGRQGNPGNAQAQGGGMGMGTMGGMGSLGGSYGSSYGGGYGGGMGTMSGMGGQPQQQGGGTCWVSQAAMDSVVAIDPATGRAGNPYKVYMKDMAITCTFTAILLVLALTGILQQLGFMLGNMISSGIGSMM